MKKSRVGFFGICLLAAMLLAGCGNQGRLDEGDCPVEVKLEALPQSFAALDEDDKERMKLVLVLKNDINGKEYEFELKEKDGYTGKARLHPSGVLLYDRRRGRQPAGGIRPGLL